MAFQVTARKWRPRRFDEVVGQEHITTTLSNAVRNGRLAHCYLFCGPRGVGKTTTARILAKLLNCSARDGLNPCGSCSSCTSITEGTGMDVLEIDGASNNSVDDVRELRELVRYIPTGGAYKIYIIDEVHMLSTAAFNALLKTLEEPPEKVIFVFATTEVQQVPETILSRCQRFNFRRIPTSQIASHLGLIAESEGIAADEGALYLLAHRADGALRDAESLLDQVSSLEEELITTDVVRQVLGLVDGTVFFDLSKAIATTDARGVLGLVAAVLDEGGDLEEFVRGYAEHASHLLHTKVHGSALKLEVADAERADYDDMVQQFSEENLLRILRVILDLEADLKRSLQPRFRVEMALVRLSRMGSSADIGQLLRKLDALAGGGTAPPSVAVAACPPQTVPSAAEERPKTATVAGADSGPSALPDSPKSTAVTSSAAIIPADLTQIRNQWDRITAEIASAHQSVGGCLAEARPLELNGAVLHLSFPPQGSFHMGLVKKNQGVVEEALARLIGTPLRIRFSLAESADKPPQSETGVSLQTDDATVKQVMDAIDGELV